MKQTVLLSQIVADPACQARVKIRKVSVKEYAEAYLDPAVSMPALLVFRDERDGEKFWLGDGFHRRLALLSLGLSEPRVEVEILEGGKRAAFLYALGANRGHGIQRTNEDKRKAVTMALGDEELRRKSDRQIAEIVGVSHNFVNVMRRGLSSDDSCGSFDDIREGKDGRVRKLGRRVAKSAQVASDSAILRQKNAVLDSRTGEGCGEKAEIGKAETRKSEGEFNVIAESARVEAELRALFASWPAEKRHLFCVKLRNFTVGHDPEIAGMTANAFDEVYESERAARAKVEQVDEAGLAKFMADLGEDGEKLKAESGMRKGGGL